MDWKINFLRKEARVVNFLILCIPKNAFILPSYSIDNFILHRIFFFSFIVHYFEGFALICFHTSSITRIQSDSCSCVADLFFFLLKIICDPIFELDVVNFYKDVSIRGFLFSFFLLGTWWALSIEKSYPPALGNSLLLFLW